MDERRLQVTEDQVLAALAEVRDPDHGENIVALGWLRGLVLRDGNVGFSIEVEAARGPALEGLRREAEDKVMALPGVVSVTAVLTAERPGGASQPQAAPQSPAPGPGPAGPAPGGPGPGGRQHAQTLLPDVTHIIAVASGKGGVGKSTVAVNLALALAAEGHDTGILDADIYGPSLPRMLGISSPPQSADGKIMEPLEKYGVKAMSIGFLIEENTPMIWRGPMVMGALEQMMRDVNWGALDVLVVDMPPGTGDAQLTMAQRVPLAGAVIVSTPQDIALIDARRGLAMFNKVNVPVFGIIENMSRFICPHCGGESHIFGHGGARDCAAELGVPFLGEIPLDIEIRETSDAGTPVVAISPESDHAACFRAIARAVWERAEGASAGRGGPKIVVE
ncbi:MAG: iron-sulfur cluster carrier protein ApbC [Alphaproteobacteria bacterium]|nr:MAG: iron-sulfur cluster carrier protein ApbC [Alphaproteobacteria bacterium]